MEALWLDDRENAIMRGAIDTAVQYLREQYTYTKEDYDRKQHLITEMLRLKDRLLYLYEEEEDNANNS